MTQHLSTEKPDVTKHYDTTFIHTKPDVTKHYDPPHIVIIMTHLPKKPDVT